MGKAKKLKVGRRQPKVALEQQIEDDKFAKPTGRVKSRPRKDTDEESVDAKLSNRILVQARKQQLELEETMGIKQPRPTLGSGDDGSNSDHSEEELEYMDYTKNFDINEEDEIALEKFMNKNPEQRRTLADIIMEKLTEKKTELESRYSDAGSLLIQELDPRVRQLYEGVRDVLSSYRSGKIPKAFKIIPSLRNWEQVLHVTGPANWSAAAMYQATRIFASNLKDKMAQRYFNLVLLPRVRDDIFEYKRLNFHLYQALHKALFKPEAFMKGFLLPLCESGTCTLREAVIIGSIIAKHSIPVLHSCAAMLKIAEMEYNGANSIFLRIFFDKKYALPYRVVDAVVFHFLRFERDPRELPVLWHQALLTFVQRYKNDISSEQKEALLGLLKHQYHEKITPEVRRELQHAKGRDIEVQEPMPS